MTALTPPLTEEHKQSETRALGPNQAFIFFKQVWKFFHPPVFWRYDYDYGRMKWRSL